MAEEKDTTADLDVVTEKAVVVRMSDCLSVKCHTVCVRALGAVLRVLCVEREAGVSGSDWFDHREWELVTSWHQTWD